jgi:hypothetical protein
MNASTRILGACAFAILSSIGAHAAQGEGASAPEFAPAFVSTATVADVRAGALMPIRIGNGSTGFIGVTRSGVDAASVRAEAAMALRSGRIPRGEAGWM